ncbi:HAD-IIA family hydrolase [Cribrihabitans marinus]|uniref:HAD-IIA family hydrolase n=1 Tax=Cribrihabitans marinus TaxID=1227549 RepID=UPI000B3249EF|nr:HAD hydrolase-like protein [Cribrihabitans marinus]GGH31283.1 haloacid dehalogenase [Cribrihabitans marinus]
MTALTVETAFDAYEAVRDRLPLAAATDRVLRRAACLDDIADDYDALLLDAFGVLNIGETAIPGVAARIAGLRARGKQVLVVSNAASASHAALVEKYARMGYDFAPEQVITSRTALLSAMDGQRGLHWGLMSNRDSGLRDLEALHLTYLEDDPAPYAEVAGFLLVGSAGWTENRQTLLEQALLHAPRPVLVGNPDIVAPREAGFSSEPGLFAHRLADRTGIVPAFFGKPFARIFDLALARLDPLPPKSRILMVGDSLHTDILGAQAAGIDSALVAGYGFFDGADVDAAIARAGIVPDYVLDRP